MVELLSGLAVYHSNLERSALAAKRVQLMRIFVDVTKRRFDTRDLNQVEWGAFDNQQRALVRLSMIVPLTIFFIYVLLYIAFNSIKYATLIIANVPFATIGGLLALFITGQYVSVPSAIGFIAVFGVAMLNGIVLVSFINELRDKGLSVSEAVRQGAELRFRSVLMTAAVAILGLFPMLLSSGVGAETQRPLALHIPAHREHPFWPNVNAHSDRT